MPPTPEPRSLPLRGRRLIRLAGVDVVAHWSLFVAFAVIAIDLGAIALPAWHPEWSAAARVTIALIAATLFFAALTLHELSHALVARRHGIGIHGITLFALGGVTHMDGEPPTPGIELAIALAGPAMSLALGVLALVAGGAIAPSAHAVSAAALVRDAGPVTTLLLWLGPANLVIGLFNLIPGFPLDGGRALRALLWQATGDLVRATRWATAVGQGVGAGLVALGVAAAVGGIAITGLWLVVIGWFVVAAARATRRQLATGALAPVLIGAVMRRAAPMVSPATPLAAFVRDRLLPSAQSAFPVVVGGDLIGMIAVDDVRRVPRERWPTTPVAAVMQPRAAWPTLSPADDAVDALPLLAEREQVPVVDGARLVGVAYLADVVEWLARPPAPAHA